MASAGTSTILLRVLALLLLAGGLAFVAWLGRRPLPRNEAPMSAWGHVEELRARLGLIAAAVLTGTFVAFAFRIEVRDWPVPVPALQDNMAAQAFRAIAAHLVPPDVTLIVARPIDGFLAEMTIALAIGVAAAFPVVWTQAARYFGPAMTPEERRHLRRGVVPAALLFATGAWFCWSFVLAFVLETLYGYGSALGATPLLSVSDLVHFAMVFLVIFGLAFQLPLAMYYLSQAGLVSSGGFLAKWRHAVVGILIVSALATDPSIVSQVMVAGPLVLLYGLGILAARLGERGRKATPASG